VLIEVGQIKNSTLQRCNGSYAKMNGENVAQIFIDSRSGL